MAKSTFFASWQLWEQMTFVLACAIVAVFCAGLTKLYWTNRLLRQQEVIDAEKQARLTQMRKTGLRGPKRVGDIPFGVRAIQSGIEVDGIWISRSTSPVSHLERRTGASVLVSAMTLVLQDDDRAPSREEALAENSHSQHSSLDSNKLMPSTTQSTEREIEPGRKASSCDKHQREARRLNEEALRQLEGQTCKPRTEADILVNSFISPQLKSFQRHGSNASSSATSFTTSESSARHPNASGFTLHYAPPQVRPNYGYVSLTPETEQRHRPEMPGLSTPVLVPRHASTLPPSCSDSLLPLLANHQPAPPQPTFGPGDMYASRGARGPYLGFEIPPAGTSGAVRNEFEESIQGSCTFDVKNAESRTPSDKVVWQPSGTKLRKKSIGREFSCR